jgi:1-acyl-sn-glycerol-3-phosphate acyltransferase
VGSDDDTMMQTLVSLWFWTLTVSIIIVGSILLIPVFLATVLFDPRRYISGRFWRNMAVVCVAANPYWSFKVAQPVPAYRPRKAVVVSNHESNGDAFLLSHLPWEMKWLSKASLHRIPFFGWCMWMAGDIPLSRGQRNSTAVAMAFAAEWLKKGMSVMVFPEGTRSPNGTMLPFKDGAFRLAIEHGADVLPIAIGGTREAVPKGSWKVGRTKALVKVGEPISTQGMTLNDVESLKAEARARVQALREEIAVMRGVSLLDATELPAA